ncbi:MAG: hypothetical protein GY708_30300 [Actinomycetia bacterium]|nr:hypothetical protein [Actinomycetes bacterium]
MGRSVSGAALCLLVAFAAACAESNDEVQTVPTVSSTTTVAASTTRTATSTTAESADGGGEPATTTEMTLAEEPADVSWFDRDAAAGVAEGLLAAASNGRFDLADALFLAPDADHADSARACALGCRGDFAIDGVEVLDPADLLVNVVISVDGTQGRVVVRSVDGRWRVDGPIPDVVFGEGGPSITDELAAVLPEPVAFTRTGVLEVYTDSSKELFALDADSAPWYDHRGWSRIEGGFGSLTDPTRTCTWPDSEPPVEPWTIAMTGGRWVAQFLVDAELGKWAMLDCETGLLVDAEPHLSFDGETESIVRYEIAGVERYLTGDAEGNGYVLDSNMRRLSDDYVGPVAFSTDGRFVAYSDHTQGRAGVANHFVTKRVVVRSFDGGAIVAEFLLDQQVVSVAYVDESIAIVHVGTVMLDAGLPRVAVLDIGSGSVEYHRTTARLVGTRSG